MTDSGNIGLIVFGLYLFIVIGIGFWAARYQQTSEDFWVAGRRFGLSIMIVANMAAIMHGGSILSGIAFAGRFGGVSTLPLAAFAAGFAVIFFFFAKKLRRSGGFTIPDYMGDRFNSNLLRGWSAVVVALSSTIYLIAQIRGMAFILETLLDVPLLWGLVIGTLIFVAYVALGGLLAVVWTNIVQFAFMWLGLLILAPFVYREVGGWFSVIEQVEAIAPGWTSVSGVQWSGWYMMSWYLIWFVAYCTRLELVTKMFAARNDKIARYSLPWSMLLIIIFLLFGIFYLGAAARILVWDDIASADQAFPALVALVLTPTLAAIALTGIASAAMSTTDSLLLMSGSAIAHDLIRKCFHEPRKIVKDERYYVNVSRLAIVGVGVVAFLCAIPDIALILRIVSFAVAIVGAAFFFPLLVGLTSKRVSTAAATASSLCGVAVTILWIVATLLDAEWALSLHPGIPGLITAGLVMGIVTTFTPEVPSHALARYFPEAT